MRNGGEAATDSLVCVRKCLVIVLARARTLIILAMALYSSPPARQATLYQEDQARRTLDVPGHSLAPLLLSAGFGDLAAAVGEVASEADWLHVDIMDAHFVPDLTIGPPVVVSLEKHTGELS